MSSSGDAKGRHGSKLKGEKNFRWELDKEKKTPYHIIENDYHYQFEEVRCQARINGSTGCADMWPAGPCPGTSSWAF